MKKGNKIYNGLFKFNICRILFLVSFVFLGFKAQATHIVGGEMSYKCLGNNQYEVVLFMYRDCFFGQAPFDQEAFIGIFDADNNLIDSLKINFSGQTDTLVNTDKCLFVPPSLCVERFIYRDTIELPFISTGFYHLVYQRCCRNATIKNITSPLTRGATWDVKITADAIKDCNSSPVFKEWPPIFICVDQKLNFDSGAEEIELGTKSDSLVYRLCDPKDGGIYIINPKPTPPAFPPYLDIPYQFPYTLANLLGGSDPLVIDPVTGIMTATPPTVGQFVVGVCVDEFRNGILYSTVRRDFQWNVVNCGKIEAFWTPDKANNCDDLEVQFTNTSTESFQYKWFYQDINKGSGDVLFSTIKNPLFTFPDTGTYVVKLVAEPNSICTDTLSQTLFFQSNSLAAKFDFEVINCIDSFKIQVLDQSTDPVSPVAFWKWNLIYDGGTLTSNLKNPQFLLSGSSLVTIHLIAESVNGCIDTISKLFQANLLFLDSLTADTIDLCKYDAVELNPDFIPSYTYQWVPATDLNPNGNVPNPIASPDKTTTYCMTYTDSTGLCNIAQCVTINALRSVDSFDFKIRVPECQDSIVIEIIDIDISLQPGSGPINWTWVLTSSFGTQISNLQNPKFVIPGASFVTISGTAFTLDSCKFEVKKSFKANNIVNPSLANEVEICFGESVALWPTALPQWIYVWTPPSFLVPNNVVPNPISTPPSTILYNVVYTDSVGLCLVKDSVLVIVGDSSVGVNFTFDVKCDGLKVEFTNTSTAGIANFKWEFGDPANSKSNLISPSFSYPGPGAYNVLLYTTDQDVCRDSIVKLVILEEPTDTADFSYEVLSCKDIITVQFNGTAFSTYGDVTAWEWKLNGVPFSTVQNPVYTFTTPGKYTVMLTVTFDDGLCTATVMKEIEIDFIVPNLPDQVLSCDGIPVALNPNGDPKYTYQWAPCDNLSDCTSFNPIASPPFAPFYSVTITYVLPTGDTCQVVDSVKVVLDPFSPLVMADTVTCSKLITLVVLNLGNNSVLWTSADGTIIGSGSDVPFSFNSDTLVIATITSPNGCIFVDTVNVDLITDIPPLFVEVSPDTIICGDLVQFTATNDPGYSYSWSPANLYNNAIIFNPTAIVNEDATFSLTIVDFRGCVNTWSEPVDCIPNACAEPFIFIPNAFSPNDDGENDRLYVRALDIIEEMELIIYNRWGEEVFKATNQSQFWDGTFRDTGEQLSPDVFGFYLKVKCFNGEEYTKKGNITIVR